MTLVPGLVSRNRSFALFENPEVRRARVRAALLRGIVRQLTGTQGRVEALRRRRARRAPARCATRCRACACSDAPCSPTWSTRASRTSPGGRGSPFSRPTTTTARASTRRSGASPPVCSSPASSSADRPGRRGQALGRAAPQKSVRCAGSAGGLEARRVVVARIVDVRAHAVGRRAPACEARAAARERPDRSAAGSSQRSHALGSRTSGIRS